MRAGTGISTALDPGTAVEAAAGDALRSAGLDRVDFALVLATTAHGDGIRRVAERATQVLATDAVLGVSVEGVMAAGIEVTSNPAVAVLALDASSVEPFLIDGLSSDAAGAGPELANWIDAPLCDRDLVVVFPDPVQVLPQRLLPALESHLAPARVVGGAAGCVGGRGVLSWLGDGPLQRRALAGFVVRDGNAQIAVTQACRPVTQPLEVTRARGNWILSIAGRPALDVYREAAMGPLAEDLLRCSRVLMAAVGAPDSGDFQVRHVVGFDEARGAFSLPQPVASGSSLWFSLLEADAARDDLRRTVDAVQGEPAFGLYFNCRARGESLFGTAGLEASYLARRFGRAPIIGMSGAFQIAPRRSPGLPAQTLTYAGVLSLFGVQDLAEMAPGPSRGL